MMNVLSSHPQNLKLRIQEISLRGKSSSRVQCPYARDGAAAARHVATLADPRTRRRRHQEFVAVRAVSGSGESSSGEDDDQENQSKKEGGSSAGSGLSREDLERLVGPDDAKFNGLDLANLIRKKYGRSYDVTLIKKEFMGRNLLAMNVMWKYREQRSFPLSEEYLLRLDEHTLVLRSRGACPQHAGEAQGEAKDWQSGEHLHRHGRDGRPIKRMDLQVKSSTLNPPANLMGD
uniref:Uncharacterized protein n=1 Tax=Arundo donax TaxID=35708 RepID=A0A0A9E220_ARUDO